MDAIYGRIGSRIRRRRRNLKILQDDLAQQTGLSRGSISNIEAGRQQLYVHHLVAIADALQQEPADFLVAAPVSDTPTAQRLLEAARRGTTARSDRRTKQ
jgi:transcriptional regulator with XRE-family HTH domain